MLSFIETRLFTSLVYDYLSDEEYASLQLSLAENPQLGPVVPGSGGVRKVRWGAKGQGKRSGVRVIYYVRSAEGVIWMLTIYGKNETENIPANVLNQIRKEIEDG
jgi:mRNA-degrading endonuclease RelE of RelBE toxin-antitoxin system